MPFNPLEWIVSTNAHYQPQRRPCLELKAQLGGFFSDELLASAGFVILDELPSPPRAQVAALGLDELLSPSAIGLTLADTYYLKPPAAGQLRVHFHELVHVVQWQALGPARFVERYLQEIRQHGYRQAPLERMAYELEHRFALNPDGHFDAQARVLSLLGQ
ncbi:hypothetical protein [Oceanimonas marisflavi]|uniref:hypothetical protein n=1 Tax=Oceanimonas marisflavi TaxID=2059724 RepID=UPI0013007875|nr:hypothetical protein [Oceanimonas marisflavi]